ncbi:MAG: L-threonylcarbamoyladenylate synthase [Gammaproteobacteria bacterium]|jgi:L-threonylcarbamoyladenylate synthase
MYDSTITTALHVLQNGGIVIMPTDTVYGLHCDAHCLPAIEKIIALKQRDANKGLILIADSLERFAEYIEPLPENISEKIRSHPGITWLVPAQKNISKLITGEFNTVAIRICKNKMIAQLSELLHSPLISTSANISHHPVAHNKNEIVQMFPEGVDLIIEGDVPEHAKPSEIRDAFTDKRVR